MEMRPQTSAMLLEKAMLVYAGNGPLNTRCNRHFETSDVEYLMYTYQPDIDIHIYDPIHLFEFDDRLIIIDKCGTLHEIMKGFIYKKAAYKSIDP